ncbi:hypothetical protein D3C76_1599680 [compost metagenome]
MMVAGLVTLGSPNIKLDLVENATHTQAIVCKNADIYQFIQKNMPAKTNAVVDPSIIDASGKQECTGVAQ